jgi:hypothetical protein
MPEQAACQTKTAMKPTESDSLRQHLLALLRGGSAHVNFDAAVAHLPARLRGIKPQGSPHTAWQLLEHLRITQRDILEFSRDAKHKSPEWPAGYWPPTEAPPDNHAWDHSVRNFRADAKAIEELIADSAADLYAPLPHGDGQTLLREALLVADHNAYHLGQLVFLRRLLNAWEG